MPDPITDTLPIRPSAPAESALVILAPQAEPIVKAYRDRWDPAAAQGLPAHVTVIYPFHPPPALAPPVSARLAQLFAEHSPFDYELFELRRFPGVLYLAPRPEAPFRALTLHVATAFPEFPPYGGRFDDVVPHLTVAETAEPARLEEIAADFHAVCGHRLPLRLRAEAVVLLDNEQGAWRVRSTFRLGA
jgi:2'-5' RNA ligase